MDGLSKTEEAQLEKLLAKKATAGYAAIVKAVDGPIAEATAQLKAAAAVITDESDLGSIRSLVNVLERHGASLRDQAEARSAG